jgi:cation:H+ antiporter
LALAGLVLMTVGGRLAVDGAERVATLLGRSDSAVGLPLVGLATEAELLALVWASVRHHTDELAGAAVVGSVAFNATLTLGGSALVHPVASSGLLGAAAAVVALTATLGVVGARRRTALPPIAGAVLLAGYAIFVATTLGLGRG